MKPEAPIKQCRVCGNTFFNGPLLKYDNMPKAAQFLPDAASLESDHGVLLEVCQCSGCGLVQLSNDPVSYYREVIRAAAFSDEMKEYRMRQFSKFVQDYLIHGKKVIEIGCGRGEYLSLMMQCGADAYGLEYSEKSVQRCVANNLRVARGFLDSHTDKLDNAPFDAFFILNFLEHLPDPNSTLRGIYNNLRDEAVGLVEVPNFDMILRNRLFSEFISDHLLYFTKETLTGTLRSNGFDIVECNEVWHEYIISATVRKRKIIDLSHFCESQMKLKIELEEYIERFKDKNVAIWGAGHQALAIISLMNLAGRIRYVIDSAPFKQGKFTPATHLPIVTPDTLDADPVDAVIVMAAGYSDEVAKIIQSKYEGRIDVCILRDICLEHVSRSGG